MKKIIYLTATVINAGFMALYIYFLMPDNAALHYDYYGLADRYGSKWELLFLAGIPLVFCAVYVIADLVIGYIGINSKNRGYIENFFGASILFFAVVMWIVLVFITNKTEINSNAIYSLLCICCGLYYVFTGNSVPKLKNNSIFGFRSKETKKNPYISRKTNRIYGRLIVSLGIAVIVLGIVSLALGKFGICSLILCFVLDIPVNILAAIYAKKLSKNICKADNPAGAE